MKKFLIYLCCSVVMISGAGIFSAVIAQDEEITMPEIKPALFGKTNYNIQQYGAKADGLTINTKSIQRAIDECNAKGGGMVVIPAGLWLTGPLTLKTNVNLHLEMNALLQFSNDFSQYA